MGLGNEEFEFWQWQEIFFFLKLSRLALGATQWVLGIRWLGPDVDL
jgi:hypothetical protein